jgi:hypothetical protein
MKAEPITDMTLAMAVTIANAIETADISVIPQWRVGAFNTFRNVRRKMGEVGRKTGLRLWSF